MTRVRGRPRRSRLGRTGGGSEQRAEAGNGQAGRRKVHDGRVRTGVPPPLTWSTKGSHFKQVRSSRVGRGQSCDGRARAEESLYGWGLPGMGPQPPGDGWTGWAKGCRARSVAAEVDRWPPVGTGPARLVDFPKPPPRSCYPDRRGGKPSFALFAFVVLAFRHFHFPVH